MPGAFMPFTYKIDTNLGLLYYWGFDVSMTEMLQVEKITSTDPLRLPSMKILIDLSDAELDVSMTDVYEAIKLNKGRLDMGRDLEATAIVSRSRFAKVIAETYRLLLDDLPIQLGIFNTLPDAVKWLGLTDNVEEINEIKNEVMHSLKKNAGKGETE